MSKRDPTSREQVKILSDAISPVGGDQVLAFRLRVSPHKITEWRKSGGLPDHLSLIVKDPLRTGYREALNQAANSIALAAHLAPDFFDTILLHELDALLDRAARGQPDDLLATLDRKIRR